MMTGDGEDGEKQNLLSNLISIIVVFDRLEIVFRPLERFIIHYYSPQVAGKIIISKYVFIQ